MASFLAIIKNGEIDLHSDYNRSRFKEWLKKNEGKPIRITTTDQKSNEARGYYFGAIIPAIATHHNSEDYELWHAILKQEFKDRKSVV